MTPQEKAIDLVDKFDELLTYRESKEKAKECALIAVDLAMEFITGDLSESFDKTLYLLDVKVEIIKL